MFQMYWLGEKLRAHISKALQARSHAIRSAVANYNEAASRLSPPRPPLEAKTVLEHVFLAQFDLLRDSRHNIKQKPWTCAAEREAATIYFKIQRAQEEIAHLNLEVHRLRTYMRDEENHLRLHQTRLQMTYPEMSYQVGKLLMAQQGVNEVHRRHLDRLENLDGFTGVRGLGTAMESMAVDEESCQNDGVGVVEAESDGDSEDELPQLALDATLSILEDN